MNSLLAELGRELTSRWAALVVLPGALYVTVATLAMFLGQADALDVTAPRAWLDSTAVAPASGRAGTVLIALVGFLVASAAAGLAAGVGGLCVERLWRATGREPVLSWFAAARTARWDEADAAVQAARATFLRASDDPTARAGLRRALARRDAVCLVRAERPTWVGDRLHAVDARVHRHYYLDLEATWPRLWLVLPDPARAELTAAQDACAAAARLGGWGLLYLMLAPFWWPATLIAVAVLLTARFRARLTVTVYADLAESAVDVYGRELVVRLGVDCPPRLTRQAGLAATSLLRKDLLDEPDPE